MILLCLFRIQVPGAVLETSSFVVAVVLSRWIDFEVMEVGRSRFKNSTEVQTRGKGVLVDEELLPIAEGVLDEREVLREKEVLLTEVPLMWASAVLEERDEPSEGEVTPTEELMSDGENVLEVKVALRESIVLFAKEALSSCVDVLSRVWVLLNGDVVLREREVLWSESPFSVERERGAVE